MESLIKTYTYANGECQRVQLVRPGSWETLSFLKPTYHPDSLERFAAIYRDYLVPGCPWLFGRMILFRLPEGLPVPPQWHESQEGMLYDPLTAAAAALRRGVRIRSGKPCFRDEQVKAFWQQLEAEDCIRIVCGKLPVTTVIPVGRHTGYLTQSAPSAAVKVNASFFIMDRIDCQTVYDQVGTPLGLCVKDGVVSNPPLFGREALMVDERGKASIQTPDVRSLTLEVGGASLRHGGNAEFFTRPEKARTPARTGQKLVIIGCRVAAICTHRRVDIPASGMVVCLREPLDIKPGAQVTCRGMENVRFGIQVGNSIVRDGEPTMTFRSRFYNLRRLERVPFPPSLYPLDFQHARAARIALGADVDGLPMLLWAEGAPKLGYFPGQHSAGASLAEMAHICCDLGMVNAINLDGGGSAQMLLNNKRRLTLSDRRKGDHAEMERPVPLALMVDAPDTNAAGDA